MIFVYYGKDLGFTTYRVNSDLKKRLDPLEYKQIIKYDCYKTSIVDILSQCLNYSIFDEKKTVLAYNCFFLTKDDKGTKEIDSDSKTMDKSLQMLLDYVNNPNPDCDLYFVLTNNIPSLKESTTTKTGCVSQILNSSNVRREECKEENIDYYIQLAFEKAKELNKKIDKDAITTLYNRCFSKDIKDTFSKGSFDFYLFLNNLDKLFTYTDNVKTVDVELLIKKPLEDDIFSLVSSLLKKDTKQAIRIYRDLRTPSTLPLNILPIISSQFTQIALVRYNMDCRMKKDEIATELSISAGKAYYAMLDAGKLTYLKLLDILNQLSQIELNIKDKPYDKDLPDVLLEMFLTTFRSRYLNR